jgi:hypothetical protein
LFSRVSCILEACPTLLHASPKINKWPNLDFC